MKSLQDHKANLVDHVRLLNDLLLPNLCVHEGRFVKGRDAF